MAVIGNSPATTGTTVQAQSFNGDNSTVAFTLNRSVNSTVDLEVLVDNVQQSPYDSSYSVSGTTLTFSEAPATGTNNIYVIYRGATISTAQVIPDDGSVTNAKMASGAALANIGTGNVTADYLNVGQLGGRRNLIINGAMQVAQRGTSFSGGTSNLYTCDRWYAAVGATFNFDVTITQDSDAPSGFSSSLKITPDTVQTPSATQNAVLLQRLEGQDLQQLAFGTSDAKSITLSFYVKSNKTGTYTSQIINNDASVSSFLSYTIDSANTWERKVLTFNGDSTNSFDNDANLSAQIVWSLVAGSSDIASPNNSWGGGPGLTAATGQVNFMDSVSNYWQITGVQLEVGSVATPYEHRSYGEELALCQRYFQSFTSPNEVQQVGFMAISYTSNTIYMPVTFIQEMRAIPTILSGGEWYTRRNNLNTFTANFGYQRSSNINGVLTQNGGGQNAASSFWVEAQATACQLEFDAEL